MKIGLPSLSSYRLRIVFRSAFTLLALATVALAVTVLHDEKQRSYANYQQSFLKTREQITAKLRHPAGQLALLNPQARDSPGAPLHPVLLPFSAIDFDDQHKVQNAVEMSGCLIQYRDGGTICVAIGNNPWAGGFIYAAGSFASESLVPHRPGDRFLDRAHRVRVEVSLRGETYRWIAPFELAGDASTGNTEGRRGRLTGFVEAGNDYARARPVKDFRGWVWQSPRCLDAEPADAGADCKKRSFYSVRLPVGILRDALFQKERPVWPPADLDRIEVHLQVLPPGDGPALFDSHRAEATRPFALNDLAPLLLPGEVLRIQKSSAAPAADLIRLTGTADEADGSSPLTALLTAQLSAQLTTLIRKLPVDGYDAPIEASEEIATPAGTYRVLLSGDIRSVNKTLSAVATRVSWFVAAMLLAILLAWIVIEIGIIRRIALLTRRADALAKTVKATRGLEHFDLADLRGRDELGILANCLHELLQRVKEDVDRERIRTEQEKDMWHAVGHEIMSPLQSLLALHGSADDPSSRYLHRMQQAIRILYGSASPSEAFQSSTLAMQAIDLDAFLGNVAANAACVGIDDVRFVGRATPVMVRADDYSLEDVVTHVLRNADRCRTPGTPIDITLEATETSATVVIHNTGAHIPDDLIDRIFEYGVSDQHDSAAQGRRGQGLFVAKTYMAKMGGTISARNVADGVELVLALPRARAGEKS